MAVKERNISLDVLRIFAAFMVLSLHVGHQVGLNDYTQIGSRGVQLFYIMSGFWAMVSMDNYDKTRSGGGYQTILYGQVKGYIAAVLHDFDH